MLVSGLKEQNGDKELKATSHQRSSAERRSHEGENINHASEGITSGV